MPFYRRWRESGGWYFFTVNLRDRRRDLLTRHIELLRHTFAAVGSRWPFNLDAAVVLPDHLHCIWIMPKGENDFSTRWRLIKSRFTKGIRRLEPSLTVQGRKGQLGIWQNRYWEHLIRNEEDYANHVDYIHYNPVKHGYVRRPIDWPYSSIHRWVKLGLIKPTWGTAEQVNDLEIE